jgi:uncharacterized protein (TIGR03437 family)
VDRVWYSSDGASLFAQTYSGRVFATNDLEQWHPAGDVVIPPPVSAGQAASLPEPAVQLRSATATGPVYAFGAFAYRSEDGGVTWANLTAYHGASILGSTVRDLAVSPRIPEEVVVATTTGVWRSADGGASWSGLNQFLPNLPISRLYAVPGGTHGIRLALQAQAPAEVEWAPGEKAAWKATDDADVVRDATLATAASRSLNATITAVALSGNSLYAGSADGQLWVSNDKGASWGTPSDRQAGAIQAIYVNPKDARIALAAVGGHGTHALRTMNGGIFWDDISANLPDAAAHGITADASGGAIYIATDAGVFYTTTDLASAGRPSSWSAASGNLPAAPAKDVRLDAGGNQVFVAVEGYGIYAAIAPHRMRSAAVVDAADYGNRPVAPGGLLSVVGAKVGAAMSNGTTAPVLAASDTASQIQVPFDVKGSTVALALDAPGGRLTFGLPLETVSPAIFVDPDGAPLVTDADSGLLLDSAKPARPKSLIQILATGLGRVRPDWPAGVAAPLSEPPQVIATVSAFLDGIPLKVTQAVLAPGYIGMYLVEVELPGILNAGPADLSIAAEGRTSNHVRLYLEN